MKKIVDLILSLDSYGEAIELNFQGKTRFNTLCGSLISAFINVVVLLFTLQQGLHFLQKNDFSIQSYEVGDFGGVMDPLNMKEQRGGFLFKLTKKTPKGEIDMIEDLDPRDGQIAVNLVKMNLGSKEGQKL